MSVRLAGWSLLFSLIVALPAQAQRNTPAPPQKKPAAAAPAKPAAKPAPAKAAPAKPAAAKPAPAKPAAAKPAPAAAPANSAPAAAAPANADAAPAEQKDTSSNDQAPSNTPPSDPLKAFADKGPLPGLTSKITPQQIEAEMRACQAKQQPRKAKSGINENTYRQIERIQNLVADGKNEEAEKKLSDLVGRLSSDYEKAVVLQTLAFVYAQENHLDKAIATFKRALELNALPQQAYEQMLLNVGQLYISNDNYGEGIQWIKKYMAESCNPAPDAYVLLAAGLAEKKQFREALGQMEYAMAKTKAPKESWLELKLALHYELKEFPQCAGVLLALVSVAPNKEQYWKQLSSMYFELGRDPQALAVLAIADRKGFINEESEFKNLANMYFFLQVPYKAGSVLQRGLDAKALQPDEKTLEMLANAWVLAREDDKAEAALKKAASVSSSGELSVRLANLYIEEENWKAGLAALEQAKQKGGVKQTDRLNMLLGVAYTELNDYGKAENAFQAALSSDDKNLRKQAADWVAHLEALKNEAAAQAAAAQAKKDAQAQAAADAAATGNGLAPSAPPK